MAAGGDFAYPVHSQSVRHGEPEMTNRLLTAGVLAAAAAFACPALAQDAARGEEIYRQCRACHQIGDNARNLVGPQLNGIVGRKAGTVEGFKYSSQNVEAGAKGLVWTEEKLFEYLENPIKFMPGTRMAFAGIKGESQRRDIIAYLKQSGDKK